MRGRTVATVLGVVAIGAGVSQIRITAQQVGADQPTRVAVDCCTWLGEFLWEISWSNWALFAAAVWAGYLALQTLEEIRKEVIATRKAAVAARKSADHAALDLRLAHRPYVDVQNLRIKVRSDSLELVWHIYNAGQSNATFRAINTVYSVPDGAGWEHEHTFETTRSPTRGFDHVIAVGPLSAADWTRYETNNFLVDIQIRVRLSDPFGDERWHLFTRRVVCGPDRAVSTAINDGWHGWNAHFQNPPDKRP